MNNGQILCSSTKGIVSELMVGCSQTYEERVLRAGWDLLSSRKKRNEEKGSEVLYWNQLTYADSIFNELF